MIPEQEEEEEEEASPTGTRCLYSEEGEGAQLQRLDKLHFHTPTAVKPLSWQSFRGRLFQRRDLLGRAAEVSWSSKCGTEMKSTLNLVNATTVYFILGEN